MTFFDTLIKNLRKLGEEGTETEKLKLNILIFNEIMYAYLHCVQVKQCTSSYKRLVRGTKGERVPINSSDFRWSSA